METAPSSSQRERISQAARVRIEQRVPAPTVAYAQDTISAMLEPLLDGFWEWYDTGRLRATTVQHLHEVARTTSGRLAWALIDEVIICMLEVMVGDAVAAGWADPVWVSRGVMVVTNDFYDGFWTFDARGTYEQALRFGRLAERIPTPVFLADGEGRMVFANAALAGLVGVAPDALVGRLVAEVFDDQVHLGDGAESDVVIGAATDRPAHLHVTVLMVPGDEDFEYFGAVEDRTKEVALETTRDQVVATISHELRTPLTAVLGYIELLVAGEEAQMTDEERTAALHTMHDEAELLLGLVHDLVDFAHLETGRIAVDASVFLLEEAVNAAVRRTYLAGEAARPVVRLPDEFKVRADRRRLEQVLTNLLTNARRYGGDAVEVEAWGEGRDAVIRVADNGPGVPADRREQIFETFFQGHDDLGVGAGIGLAVCRAVARAHGGTIAVEDRPGASFRIDLPGAII